MSIIKIVRNNGTVAFDPPESTIVMNTAVVFRNNDPQSQHWITLSTKAEDFWFTSPLAPAAEGQPDDTSSEVLFTAATPAGQPVVYVCSMHPEETGTIVVTAK